MDNYTAELSSIKTVFCEFDFLSDEYGNKLEIKRLDETREVDFLVTSSAPICEYPLKSSFVATIENISAKDDEVESVDDFSAIISLFEPITSTIEVV